MNGSSPSDSPHPETNEILHSESKQPIVLETSESTVNDKPMHENRTDDEKSESLQIETKKDPDANHSTSLETEESLHSSGEQKTEVDLESSPNDPCSPVEETVEVTTATTAQSFAVSSMDGLLITIDEDEGSFEDQTRYSLGVFQFTFSDGNFLPLERSQKKQNTLRALSMLGYFKLTQNGSQASRYCFVTTTTT